MKIYNAYSNQELINKLIDRDAVTAALYDFDLSDDELIRVNKYKQLSQFERDLLYLYSQTTVEEISSLYMVSKTHIYNFLKQIKQKLK